MDGHLDTLSPSCTIHTAASDVGVTAVIARPVGEARVAQIRDIFRRGHQPGSDAGSDPDPPPSEDDERRIETLERKVRTLEAANQELIARETYLRAIIEAEPECALLANAYLRFRSVYQSPRPWREKTRSSSAA